ncbi:MAG: hypothetical protein ACD_67C00024G0009 [uncultured bacterium]|nr:MAG: hypothetical protein ACD_67C00024G0009 [uncultured bacterium]
MMTCSKCALCKKRGQIVFGTGNSDAKIIFVGEAPGRKEAELGIPFVGSSGIILEKMLASVQIKREDVYLTNICKCRPPENRDPLPEEIQECRPWLEKQIGIINPKIIITLGRFALNSFLPDVKISEVHGQTIEIKIPKVGKVNIFPSYHPAAARINRKTRALFEEDFKKIPKLLKK